MLFKKNDSIEEYIVPILKGGGIGVIPTDTLYGVVCSALRKQAVERVYNVRMRSPDKPCIILIHNIKEVESFGVSVSKMQTVFLEKIWPGRVSVILECKEGGFEYLSRKTGSLSFRVPDVRWLRELLKETGPLIAPSANIEGCLPARNICEARRYFSDKVDFYLDFGKVSSDPSTIVDLSKNGKFSIIRGNLDIK